MAPASFLKGGDFRVTDNHRPGRGAPGGRASSQAPPRLQGGVPPEYDWSAFADRWPAILDSFALGYRNRAALWTLPPPLVPEGSPLLDLA